jgi:uncharacterized membrane protein
VSSPSAVKSCISKKEVSVARIWSIRPGMTLQGRKFKGLRGWAGKPFHPPLTDFPVAAYVLAAVFDIISVVAGKDSSVAHDFFVSGTHVIIAGAFVSLGTALTGFWDWWKSMEPGTQARRTANWHMTVMLIVTGIVIVDIVVRLVQWSDGYTQPAVLILSILSGLLVAYGATYGGTLVFDYGFNVETAGDHPVWHKSEADVMPSQKEAPADTV